MGNEPTKDTLLLSYHLMHPMYYNLYLPTDFIQARGDATFGVQYQKFRFTK